jgi:AcrR family transcriptional regulator
MGSCQPLSPKIADPEVRVALLDLAARIVGREGTQALTARRLATELGTSTTAVYTHFGGMDGLRREVRRDGFARLTDLFDTVPETGDPVADLSALGWAYCFNGVVNAHLYRAVFLEPPIDADDEAVGRAAVQQPIDAVARSIEAGRFDPADPEALAVQLWTASHGMVCAVLARLLTIEEITEQFSAMGRNLYVGFGDDPVKAQRSIDRAEGEMQPRAAEVAARAASAPRR